MNRREKDFTDIRTIKKEMAPKKNKSKDKNKLTKIPKRQNERKQRPTSKADTEKFVCTDVKELMNKKVRSPLLKKIVAHADVSSILKEPGDPFQEDVEEDSFNPPLHSTAVYSDGDELLQITHNPERIPAKLMSPIRPVVQEKRRPNHQESKRKPAANTEPKAPGSGQAKRTPQKKALDVPEPGSSKKHRTLKNLADGTPPSAQAQSTSASRNGTPQNKSLDVPEPGSSKKHRTLKNLADGTPPSAQAQSASASRNGVSAKKERTPRKEQNMSSKKKSRKDRMQTASGDIGSPENAPKSVRSVNELDVVLFESGKLIELYRENVETDVCKRAIDVFFNSFKEQLSTTISDVRKLKDLKRKNAKMQSEIGRKRKRLLEVKDEIIAKQPKLNELQKECSELEQKKESLKRARTVLDNIVHLQEDYMKFKAKNPHIKETYGTSSLPALCLETESVLKAEQHLHIVNRQLQSFIEKEKGD